MATSDEKLARKRELARLRQAKRRKKLTAEQKKKISKQTTKRKAKWASKPENHMKQLEYVRKSKQKRKRVMDEAEDYYDFLARMEASSDSGFESDN